MHTTALADEADRQSADKRRCHEATKRAKALAAKALAYEQRCQEAAMHTNALATQALAVDK